MTINETIKKRVKELVDGVSISKSECAKQIGISYTTLNRLYNHGKNVRIYIILQIATYFDVSTDYILGRSDDKERKSHRQ